MFKKINYNCKIVDAFVSKHIYDKTYLYKTKVEHNSTTGNILIVAMIASTTQVLTLIVVCVM